MTYGTLDYWRTSSDRLGKQCANQRAEIDALWHRLHQVTQAASRGGVAVGDASLIEHSNELEAQAVCVSLERDHLDGFRMGVVQDIFLAVDAVEKHGASKSDMFDKLTARLLKRNSKAFHGDELVEARKIVAARESEWSLFEDARVRAA